MKLFFYLLLVLVPFIAAAVPGLRQPTSICGYDQSEEAICQKTSNPSMYQESKAVLRILLNGRAHCTGFLVGDEGHVLTNWHCIKSKYEDMAAYQFEAMAESESCSESCAYPSACPGTYINSKPLTFITTGGSMEKDFTLLQLAPEDREEAVANFGYIQLRESGPVLEEEIYVPQHPEGWGKRIAMKDGDKAAKIIDLNAGDFNGCGENQVAYRADTRGGSSGSPILSTSDNYVVAIHHCGGCSEYGNTAISSSVVLEDLAEFLPESARYSYSDNSAERKTVLSFSLVVVLIMQYCF